MTWDFAFLATEEKEIDIFETLHRCLHEEEVDDENRHEVEDHENQVELPTDIGKTNGRDQDDDIVNRPVTAVGKTIKSVAVLQRQNFRWVQERDGLPCKSEDDKIEVNHCHHDLAIAQSSRGCKDRSRDQEADALTERSEEKQGSSSPALDDLSMIVSLCTDEYTQHVPS